MRLGIGFTSSSFAGETTAQAAFTGERTERPPLIRRNTWTKLEGDMLTETTARSEFRDYETVERTTTVRRREDNLVVGGGHFQVIPIMRSENISRS